MVYAIFFLVFFTAFFVIIGAYNFIFRERLSITARLEGLTATPRKINHLNENLDKPFFERVIRPVLEKAASLTSKVIPARKKITLQNKLMMAGHPGDLSPNEFVVLQYSLMAGLPLLVLFITLPMGWSVKKIVLLALLAFAVGMMLPEYYLKSRARGRQEDIQKSLPDVLDLLTVSVEAGLGFDAALVKVIEKVKGVMSDEFNRVLQEIKMGKPRREALRDLGNRVGVDDVSSFVGAIVQADQLGVSIGNVLRLQSEQMRSKRRQRAEEKAMKAPIKMLIPLLFFIFPTIFIVLMGPAVIQVIEMMSR